MDFLLELKGPPQKAEESFPRYGGYAIFRSSAIPGGCHREPFQENPDQVSTRTIVGTIHAFLPQLNVFQRRKQRTSNKNKAKWDAHLPIFTLSSSFIPSSSIPLFPHGSLGLYSLALDNRSTTNHLHFIVDLLLREQGSDEEGSDLITLFGDPDPYPNNNDDSPSGNSDDSDDSSDYEGFGDSEDSEGYGSSEYWSETSDDEDQYVTDQREDVDVEPEKQEILDKAQTFFTEQYSYGTWMSWMQMNRDKLKLKPTEEGAEPTSKETPKETTSMSSLLFELPLTYVSPKISSPSPESKSTVETGSALNVGPSQSYGECSKSPSEPSLEQGRNAKRAYGEVDDEDDDGWGSFFSSNGRYAFKQLRQ